MQYILKGDPREVAKVLQENRIRVDRGVIEFTPCQPETADNSSEINTLLEVIKSREEDLQRQLDSNFALIGLAREVVAIVVENGSTIPDDMAASLEKFGISVPKIENPAEKTADRVPEPAEIVPNMEDTKEVIADDMKEVNLDDVKDPIEEDTKEPSEATPKKTRTKKSE